MMDDVNTSQVSFASRVEVRMLWDKALRQVLEQTCAERSALLYVNGQGQLIPRATEGFPRDPRTFWTHAEISSRLLRKVAETGVSLYIGDALLGNEGNSLLLSGARSLLCVAILGPLHEGS